jgi:retron-type reverse transcriptase
MASAIFLYKELILPKTYANLWPEIIDWSNLLKSYHEARRGKRYSPEALDFGDRLEENLINIQNHLIWKTWQPGAWREFWVNDPKLRLIQAPPFADRVVHHALVDVIEPHFEGKMIYDSYACRRGKGTHRAVARVQHQLKAAHRNWGRVYVLQADISKYFPSINHDVLLSVLARTIRDQDVLWLCGQIIRNCGYDERGIPVGALTSQLFANVYLTMLDHKIKDDWGVPYYVRYMDDFVILGRSKAELWDLLAAIETYLAADLRLALNPKTRIYPAGSRLVDFAGYRVCATHKLPRKRNIQRARDIFRKMARDYRLGLIDLDYVKPRVMSFLGYVWNCSARMTTDSVLNELKLIRG